MMGYKVTSSNLRWVVEYAMVVHQGRSRARSAISFRHRKKGGRCCYYYNCQKVVPVLHRHGSSSSSKLLGSYMYKCDYCDDDEIALVGVIGVVVVVEARPLPKEATHFHHGERYIVFHKGRYLFDKTCGILVSCIWDAFPHHVDRPVRAHIGTCHRTYFLLVNNRINTNTNNRLTDIFEALPNYDKAQSCINAVSFLW